MISNYNSLGAATQVGPGSIALDQGVDSIASTSTDGVVLSNTTAASSTVPQYSPRLRLRGQGWKTTATAASQPMDWKIENQTRVDGSVRPNSDLVFATSVNGGAYNTFLTLRDRVLAGVNDVVVSGRAIATNYDTDAATGGYRINAQAVMRYDETFTNFALGKLAGGLSMSGGASGAQNFICGNTVQMPSGSANTTFGWDSGRPTTGTTNSFFGHDAGLGINTGSGNVFVGKNAGPPDQAGSIQVSDCIGIGTGAVATASNQLVIGGTSAITDGYIGSGVTKASPSAVTIQATGGSGSNNAGANLTIAGGKSTGSATPASIFFSTSTAGGSSSTLQTLSQRWQINGNGGHFIAVADNTYDIGASGATRPRTGYFGTSVESPLVTLGTAGSVVGQIDFKNATSGTISLIPVTGALGTVSLSLPAATDTLVGRNTTDTFTNKRITPRVTTISSNATWSPNADTDDQYVITAQAVAVTTISNPSGTPVDGQKLMFRIKDSGGARALSWTGTQWRASSDLALPTTTTISKTMYLGFVWNSADSKWDLLAKLDNFT